MKYSTSLMIICPHISSLRFLIIAPSSKPHFINLFANLSIWLMKCEQVKKISMCFVDELIEPNEERKMKAITGIWNGIICQLRYITIRGRAYIHLLARPLAVVLNVVGCIRSYCWYYAHTSCFDDTAISCIVVLMYSFIYKLF